MSDGDVGHLSQGLAKGVERLWHGEDPGELTVLAPRLLDEAATSINFPCLRDQVASVRSGFPDVQIELEHTGHAAHAIAQVWMLRGTHLGAFLGIPATGKRFQARMMSYHRLEGGRVARTDSTWELAGVLAQIGALALPPPTVLEEGPLPNAGLQRPDARAVRGQGTLGWPHEGADVDHELHPMEDAVNRALASAWNDRDLSQSFALVRAAHRVKGMLEEARRGLEAREYEAFHASLCEAFPDIQLAYLSSLGSEEAVASVTQLSGTHLGPFMGVPATGRSFSITTMAFAPHRGGVARGAVNGMDLVGLLEQLGVVRVHPFEDLRVAGS